jgi:hypothetical protein
MSPLYKLTEDLCSEIENEIKKALQPIAEKYQLNLSTIKGQLFPDGTTYSCYTQLSLPERPQTVASVKEEEDYLCYAESFGMRAEWLGRSFNQGNFDYKVVGLRVDAPTECAILERSDGSRCYKNGKYVSHNIAS